MRKARTVSCATSRTPSRATTRSKIVAVRLLRGEKPNCICSVRAAHRVGVQPEANEPSHSTSTHTSSAASQEQAAGVSCPPQCSELPDHHRRRDTPPRDRFPCAGCRLFTGVTLSRRRHFHRTITSLPRAPRSSSSRRGRTDRHQATRSARSNARRCATAAGVVSTAARRWSLISRRSTTSIRSRTAARTSPGNLVLACGRCNRLKGDMLPNEFFTRYPWAGLNFIAYARAVHRALKRCARRAVSLACARAA